MPQPEFKISAYVASHDYPTLVEFWRGHGVEPWPEHVMAGRGCVAELDGELAAIGLYYVTDAALCILAPVVSDPKLPLLVQAAAIVAALEAVVDRAKADCKDGLLYAMAHDASVLNVFVKRHGFRDTGSVKTAGLATGESFSLDIIDEGN